MADVFTGIGESAVTKTTEGMAPALWKLHRENISHQMGTIFTYCFNGKLWLYPPSDLPSSSSSSFSSSSSSMSSSQSLLLMLIMCQGLF